MSQVRFPKRREDGSVSVAARFTFDAPFAVEAAEATLRKWIAQHATETGDPTEDLVSEPYVVVRDQRTLDVVFDGLPGSPRWKDWMVALSQEMTAVYGVTFTCFYDLVADAPHPASRNLR